MKYKIYLFIAILFCMLTANAQKGKDFECIIKGIVVDRPYSSMLYLIKSDGDYRTDKIEIPIQDSKFEYKLSCNFEESYSLAFEDELNKGSWTSIDFISEPGVIDMILYPDERSSENQIKGGYLNQISSRFLDKKRTLYDIDKLYEERNSFVNRGLTETAYNLYQKIRNEKDNQIP